MKQEHHTPAQIERASMEIIQRELEERGICLPEENAHVIRRVIHTTADFEYVENLYFSPSAVGRAMETLKTGTVIVTDTNMAKAGVSKAALKRLGGEVFCFMAEPEVTEEARKQGSTRAAAAMELAGVRYPKAVFAVGNAPTALLRLCELMEEGLRPALVIGVPVGFVNVVESKERLVETCRKYHIPVITAMGRKGGSNVAAAICNALLYQAAELIQPEKRGW
ncbi:precorrin-8X methylmutase [Anaerotignum lactatifermentans]|uniref:Precorrin-8X methylmutase n=1 Tax=Anaerotignum lactatifermentans TaxID=160404 RepID=A0ABS2GC98_9FIRM|nr:precorrin-8X methylmutase [Anaerotignum lactatifermentans]MBM6829813.1 precorrin-8X methylmutase [Anaerotignum lactatifermentans]MBM6878247.1 precorrin-8X methylmutase [Anaerotignum lactatifermentans]MBM6951327.1 precorrin-8X methylmutase [Anaerotignum lactatifermentans]